MEYCGADSQEILRNVSIYLGEKYAQHDSQINIYYMRPRKRKRENFRLVRDGLRAYRVEVDGRIDWDSTAHYPIYSSFAVARAANDEGDALTHKRICEEISAEEFVAQFDALVSRYNGEDERRVSL